MGKKDPRRMRPDNQDNRYNNGTADDPDADDDPDDDDEGDDVDMDKSAAILDADRVMDVLADMIGKSTKKSVRKAVTAALTDKGFQAELKKALGIDQIVKSVNQQAELVKALGETLEASIDSGEAGIAEIRKAFEGLKAVDTQAAASGTPTGGAKPHDTAPLQKAADGNGQAVDTNIGGDHGRQPNAADAEYTTVMQKALAAADAGTPVDGWLEASYEVQSHGKVSDVTFARLKKAV